MSDDNLPERSYLRSSTFLKHEVSFSMTCLPLKGGSTLTQRPAMFAIAVTVLAVLIGSSARAAAQSAGEGGNSLGFDMAPETSQRVVEDAVKQIPTPMAPGPVKPTWDSLK
jgi:hypothetical protein